MMNQNNINPQELLTGKALKAFTDHYLGFELWDEVEDYDDNYISIHGHREIEIHALIMDWLDSVGILIFPRRFTHLLKYDSWYYVITNEEGVHLNNYLEDRVTEDSRQQATKEAIKKAVYLYNERNEE